jgi:hypothetical protein
MALILILISVLAIIIVKLFVSSINIALSKDTFLNNMEKNNKKELKIYVYAITLVFSILSIVIIYPWILNEIMLYMKISYVWTWETVLCLGFINSFFTNTDILVKMGILWEEKK